MGSGVKVKSPSSVTSYVPSPAITSGLYWSPVFKKLIGSINIIVDGTIVPSTSVSLLVISLIVTGVFSLVVPESGLATGRSLISITITGTITAGSETKSSSS